MNAVIKKIPALVEEELAAANNIHSFFHSYHEGYAVLKEEVDEAHAEMIDIEAKMTQLWRMVKSDSTRTMIMDAHQIEKHAVQLAAEAIQVAAMARKFRATKLEERVQND